MKERASECTSRLREDPLFPFGPACSMQILPLQCDDNALPWRYQVYMSGLTHHVGYCTFRKAFADRERLTTFSIVYPGPMTP